MVFMIMKMIIATGLYIFLTVFLWRLYHTKTLSCFDYILIGLIYGICSIASNHVSINYGEMLLNVRDIGPLAAGLIFHPLSGIIAGLIGGIERYISGTYWDVGSYTTIACSLSTCFAGFLAAILKIKLFQKHLLSPVYAFFIGAVMEVFHMYSVFFTHRDDMAMAFYAVKTCSIPMIFFTGLGLFGCSIIIILQEKKLHDYFYFPKKSATPISVLFQSWLFAVTAFTLFATFIISYSVQTRSAYQSARRTLRITITEAKEAYKDTLSHTISMKNAAPSDLVIGDTPETLQTPDQFDKKNTPKRYVFLTDEKYNIVTGPNTGKCLLDLGLTKEQLQADSGLFKGTLFDTAAFFRYKKLKHDYVLLAAEPIANVYLGRDISAYETAFADILLFTAIFVLISILTQKLVVHNLNKVNASLAKITDGNLDEVVSATGSLEFSSLSKDINITVNALKGYIQEAEMRIEKELMFARSIQNSALPRVFTFPNRSELDLFATMTPAKEVGGDFYDFFFIDPDRIVFVIADVAGKGIPAALYMMRGKTAIRSLAQQDSSPSEIFHQANLSLCEGNDADMFITSWIGILNLKTGLMQCANAGHEYPILMREDGNFELYKDKHTVALGIFDSIVFKEYTLQLNPGDKVFVYTDGVPEAINHNEEQFGTDRLLDTLNSGKNLPMNELLPFIHKTVDLFANGLDQFDDLTMLGFTLEHLS